MMIEILLYIYESSAALKRIYCAIIQVEGWAYDIADVTQHVW